MDVQEERDGQWDSLVEAITNETLEVLRDESGEYYQDCCSLAILMLNYLSAPTIISVQRNARHWVTMILSMMDRLQQACGNDAEARYLLSLITGKVTQAGLAEYARRYKEESAEIS